jgi:hypothetical protein
MCTEAAVVEMLGTGLYLLRRSRNAELMPLLARRSGASAYGRVFYFLQEDFDRPALEMAVRMISTMDFSPPPFLKKTKTF